MSELRVIAVKECADGNAEAGSNWVETKMFSSDDPISAVLDWADGAHLGVESASLKYHEPKGWRFACRYGRLMLTVERELK